MPFLLNVFCSLGLLSPLCSPQGFESLGSKELKGINDEALMIFAMILTILNRVSDLTDGRVMIEPHVVVSDSPLTATSQYAGMVMPENIPDDVSKYVSEDQWDTVGVYNAFTEHAYWGVSEAAGVGWFSVNHRTDVCYDCDAVVC